MSRARKTKITCTEENKSHQTRPGVRFAFPRERDQDEIETPKYNTQARHRARVRVLAGVIRRLAPAHSTPSPAIPGLHFGALSVAWPSCLTNYSSCVISFAKSYSPSAISRSDDETQIRFFPPLPKSSSSHQPATVSVAAPAESSSVHFPDGDKTGTTTSARTSSDSGLYAGSTIARCCSRPWWRGRLATQL